MHKENYTSIIFIVLKGSVQISMKLIVIHKNNEMALNVFVSKNVCAETKFKQM